MNTTEIKARCEAYGAEWMEPLAKVDFSELVCELTADGYDKSFAELASHAREDIPALLAEVERLREAQCWIPVGERLPELLIPVLAYYDAGVVVTDFYGYVGWTYLGYGNVTHWRPLPAGPEEGENHG